MGTEQWHAIIYYHDGRTKECAFSNDRASTARTAQMIFDQDSRTAISDYFMPTRIEIVRDN